MRTLLLFLAILSVSQAQASVPTREDARYHLQNLYNEMDLLIKNQRSDASDIKRQEREAEELKLYERIPFQRDEKGIKADLASSAGENGLKLKEFHSWKAALRPPKPVPRFVYTDDNHFKLAEDQLVETIPFSIVVEGDSKKVESWVSAWSEQVMRLVKPIRKPTLHQGAWLVEGIAYRFRPVQFPRLVPKNPMSLIPTSERKDLPKKDPALWQLTQQINELRPRTPALYAARGRFLLDGARTEFLLRRLNGSR